MSQDRKTVLLVEDQGSVAAAEKKSLEIYGYKVILARSGERAIEVLAGADPIDIIRGLTTGGPGEILSAPDSEAAFAMLESFVTLFEITGDDEWLAPAHDLLRQCATWVVSYDYQFPPDSTLGKSQARTTGAVWANIQNKCAAPGICTLSGDVLLRLWRASGDPLALDLLGDIAHGLPQYM